MPSMLGHNEAKQELVTTGTTVRGKDKLWHIVEAAFGSKMLLMCGTSKLKRETRPRLIGGAATCLYCLRRRTNLKL